MLLPVAYPGLVERDSELARVERLLDQAGQGNGAVAVIEGPAGIGKSELLAAVRTRTKSRGFGLLTARGSEFEAGMAFGAARQLLEPLLHGAPAAERERLLEGVARIGGRVLDLEPGEPPVDAFAAIHGLYWLCANRAELGPLGIVVDDLQWVDAPSLAWLGYLARRAGDLAVLLMFGLRSGDPGGRGEVDQLAGDPATERIVLSPLSVDGAAAIVRARLDPEADPEFCTACRELTGGNPLLVRELLAAAASEGLPARSTSVEALGLIAPAAIGTSVLTRLGRMGPDAVTLAQAVAVLGPEAEVAVAARLAELDPEQAELLADRLAAAQILAPIRPLEFFHPLIGAAVREDMAPGARRLAHRRAATLVDGPGSAARVAAHLLACAPAGDSWVVERLTEAATDALERGAPEVAATYLKRALAEPPDPSQRAEQLLALGTAEWRAGQPEAIAHLEQAATQAGEDWGTSLGANFLLALAMLLTDRGAEGTVEVLERALQAVVDRDPQLALTVEAALGLAGMMDDRTAPDAMARAAGLRERAGTTVEPPVHLLVLLLNYAARQGHAAEARELTELVMASDSYPPPGDIAVAAIGPVIMLEAYDLLDRICEDLFAAALGRGALREMVGISVLRASGSNNRGQVADAEADARWALERAEGIHLHHAVSELVRILIERDELDEAERVLDTVEVPGRSHSIEAARLLLTRGRLRAAQGQLAEARDDLLEAGRRCDRMSLMTTGGGPWRCDAALVQLALGETAEARRLANEQLELARAFGRPRQLGMSLRVSGLVEGGEPGMELLEEAVATLEPALAPVELARALTDHGAALRRAGQRVRARAQLERGLDTAHHCGAHRIARLAREELLTTGAQPRRDAITGRDALTPGELRVARLAISGLTNREIAQALFVTAKTVDTHLSHAYSKLGISSRRDLAGAIDEAETGHAVAP
jgi:DNA-binding CsgD family transcriptional regulator